MLEMVVSYFSSKLNLHLILTGVVLTCPLANAVGFLTEKILSSELQLEQLDRGYLVSLVPILQDRFLKIFLVSFSNIFVSFEK